MITVPRLPAKLVSTNQVFIFYSESTVSGASKASFTSRVKEAKQKEAEERPDWQSTTSERRKISAEDRMASKIAAEVLKENAKLRGVHSKDSIKMILEKEALK
jgi:hypothetical protein